MERMIYISNEPMLVRPAGLGYDVLVAGVWIPADGGTYAEAVLQYDTIY